MDINFSLHQDTCRIPPFVGIQEKLKLRDLLQNQKYTLDQASLSTQHI